MGFPLLVLVVALPLAAADEPGRFTPVPERETIRFEPGGSEATVPGPFRLARHEFESQARFSRESSLVRRTRVTFPSPVVTDVPANNTVHAEYFQPRGAGPLPACVVLHILGGDFLLAETVALHLAQHGIGALFVKMPYYGPRRAADSPKRMIALDPAESVANMTQAVLDIRRATAWLAARPEVDARRLGITGISLGGIMTALAAEGEPRLRNVAIVLGGGNFAEMLWANETRQARQFREQWVAAGGTAESFRQTLAPVDPVTHGASLRGRRVLMIAAKNDEIVSPSSATALWEAIGKEPELVWLDAGHYSAIRYLPHELVRLDLFFNGR